MMIDGNLASWPAGLSQGTIEKGGSPSVETNETFGKIESEIDPVLASAMQIEKTGPSPDRKTLTRETAK